MELRCHISALLDRNVFPSRPDRPLLLGPLSDLSALYSLRLGHGLRRAGRRSATHRRLDPGEAEGAPASAVLRHVREGDIIRLETSGGGGFGDDKSGEGVMAGSATAVVAGMRSPRLMAAMVLGRS